MMESSKFEYVLLLVAILVSIVVATDSGKEYPRGECSNEIIGKRCNYCCTLMGRNIVSKLANNNCMCFKDGVHILTREQIGLYSKPIDRIIVNRVFQPQNYLHRAIIQKVI